MRRRHRRVLFNLFAFSLLGIAVYLNMFCMNDDHSIAGNRPIQKQTLAQPLKADKLMKAVPVKPASNLKKS